MERKKLYAARALMTVLTAAVICFIFGNSLASADDSSARSGRLVALINSLMCGLGIELEVTQHFVRKTAHFTEFAALGALSTVTVYLYTHKRRASALIAAGIGLLTAVCDELIQMFSSGRSCELRDMLIDFSGAALAALTVFLILKVVERKREGNK